MLMPSMLIWPFRVHGLLPRIYFQARVRKADSRETHPEEPDDDPPDVRLLLLIGNNVCRTRRRHFEGKQHDV